MRIYCEFEGGFTSKCGLERGYQKVPTCDNCTYFQETILPSEKTKRRLDQLRKEIEDKKRLIKEAEDQGRIRFTLDPLDLKKRGKMPKELYVKDPYAGKKRRLRFDKDYWKRNRFQHSLCQICNRVGERKITLKMTIQQVIGKPEMKWLKHSNQTKPRTLTVWRRELCQICQKDNSNLKIGTGRPRNLPTQ